MTTSPPPGYPLTPMQQGMLYMTLETPPYAGCYVEQVVGRLPAPVDAAAFARAWREVYAACPVLGNRLQWRETDQPFQQHDPNAVLPINTLQWQEESDIDAMLADFLEQDRRAGFAMDKAPLTRLTLIQTAAGLTHFVWTVHHVLIDGRAMARVIQAVFAALNENGRTTIAGADFRTYAEQFNSPPGDETRDFWQRYLKDFSARTELPLQSPSSPNIPQSGRGDFGVSANTATFGSDALNKRAAHAGVTDGTLVQAAWGALLFRLTGNPDILFGATKSVSHGRPAGAEPIGLYINTLPLRLKPHANLTVARWLSHVRDQWTRLRPHEHAPLNQIAAWSDLPGGEALFESTLVYDRTPLDGLIKAGQPHLIDHRFSLHECTPGDLTLAIYGGEVLTVVAEFDRKRFHPTAIDALLDGFLAVLRAMVDNPVCTLAQLPLVSPEARDRLFKWGHTPPPVTPANGVLERIDHWVNENPGAVAVEQPGEAPLTREELDAQSRAVAAALLARGVQPDDRVGVSIPRSPRMIAAVLGILRAGAAYVPLDPSYPEDRLSHMCSDAGLREIVTTRELAQQWQSYVKAPLAVEDIDNAPTTSLPAVHPENLAYVIYTSGSTGVPKGVLVHHGALGAFTAAAGEAYGVRPEDRVLQFASLSFDAAVEEIILALCNGLPLVLRTEDMLTSAAGFFDACAATRVTILDLPTAYWHILVDEIAEKPLPASVRIVIIGGEAAQPEKLAIWQQHVSENVALLNTYGPTEATVVATFAPLQKHTGGVPPIGKPLPGTQVHVLDANDALLPAGFPGELYIGGPQVAQGYHNRPDLNRKRFVTSPFDPGARLYRTGDRVCFNEDGQLLYLGRFDRQVKLRGFRVELEGIESAIREHEQVGAAAVTVYEPAPGKTQLVAYVVFEQPDAASLDTLRGWIEARLPAYMQPARWMVLEKLPVAATGKVDYKALPAPEEQADHTCTPPGTPTEEALLEIWKSVLGFPDFGCTDDFFSVGGHSLLGVQMISRIRDLLRKTLPLRAIFEYTTIQKLAEHLDTLQVERPGGEIRPVPRDGGMPLSYDQQVLWLFEQVYPGTQTYHIPIAYRLRGSLRVDLLERSLAEIIARHEALRTTFAVEGGEPVQLIGKPFNVPLATHPLPSGTGSADQRMHQWLCDRAVQPFDLARGPLIRGDVLSLGEDDHVFCLVVHHIIFDGWSVGVLVKELRALYAAYLEDAPSPLSPLALQYADFTTWERTRFDPLYSPSVDYWRQKMARPLPFITWPDDPSNKYDDPRQGAQIPVRIPRDLVNALQKADPTGTTSLFMKLLAVFNILLARYTGSEEFIVGATSANRDYVALEKLTGFFINTISLRTQLNMDGSFLDLLATEKEVVLGAQAHQDLPFYILREMAQDPKDQRAIIQALFLMQNMEIPPLHLPGVRAETLNVDMGKAIVDLTLEMYETEAGMHGWFEYATRIFSAATIARLARYYVLLIEAVVENPRLPLKALPDFSAVSAPDPGSLPPIWIVPTPPEKVRTSTLSELPGGRMLPEDPVERRVAEIWARVIGSREIYRHDNFFKIGGHSLFAVVMLGHVERIFGKRIAPLRLYQAPTLSEFAALLREGGIKPPRTSVHAIRETGGRTPMYFVGSTDLLPPMADALGPDQPLYSLNIFGLQEPDGGYTFTSVPDIAARFIQDMRAVQPSGPYVLGGYCRDTMVAYEMARQLQADGEEIAHVALVDTYWDTWDAYGRWHRHFRNLRMLGPGYVVEKWRRKVKAWRELYNRIHSRRVARRTTSQGALAHSHRDTLFINAYYDIVASSEPGEYRGDVHLYAASEWGLRDVPNWRRIVHGKVSLEEVQACHYNLWDPPQVDRLGSAIRAQLETGRHPRQ